MAWIRRLGVAGGRHGLDPMADVAGCRRGLDPGLAGEERKAVSLARVQEEGHGREVVRSWGKGGGAVVGEGER